MKKLLLLLAVLVPFAVFSLFVVETQGLLGLLALGEQPWGLQVIVDLYVSLGLFSIWMLRDAKERGVTAWPYVVAMIGLGSIGALAYLARRTLQEITGSGASARPAFPAG